MSSSNFCKANMHKKKFKSQRTTLNAKRIDIRNTKCTRNRVRLRIKVRVFVTSVVKICYRNIKAETLAKAFISQVTFRNEVILQHSLSQEFFSIFTYRSSYKYLCHWLFRVTQTIF